MTARQIVNIPFTGGLDQKTSELVRRPGANLVANHVRQVKKGEWRQANNFTRWTGHGYNFEPYIMLGPLGPGGLGNRGGVFGVANNSDSAGSSPLSCFDSFDPTTSQNASPLGYWGGTTFDDLSSPSVWSRKNIANFPSTAATGSPTAVLSIESVGFAAGYDTTGTVRMSMTAWSNANNAFLVTMTNDETGEVAISWKFTVTSSLQPIRCAYAGSGKFVVVYKNGTAIDGAVFTASPGAIPTTDVTTLTNIATGLDVNVRIIDAMSFAANAVTIIGCDNATKQVRFVVLNATSATVTTNTLVAQACDVGFGFISDPYASGDVYIGAATAGTTRVLRCTAVGGLTTNDNISTTAAQKISGCALKTAGDYIAVYTDVAGLTTRTRGKSGGVLQTEQSVSTTSPNWRLDSQAWMGALQTTSSPVIHFIMGYHGSAPTLDPQDSYYEFAATPFNVSRTPQAHLVPLNAAVPVQQRETLYQVSKRSANSWSTALRTLKRFTFAGGGYVYAYSVDAFTVIYPSLNTIESVDSADVALMNYGKPVQLGPNTFVPFGTGKMLNNGGASHMGPINVPPKLTLAQSAGGSLTALGTYLYVRVDVLLDAFGNIYRSKPSTPASITLTGGNQTVTVTGEISWTGDTDSTRIKTEIYRTMAGGTVYQKVSEQEWSGQTLGTFGTWSTDTLSDSGLANADFLYTTGEVANGIPPRPAHICVANGRMWVVDADNRQRLFFSKNIRNGFLPEFVDTFILDITDDQGDITGIQSLDDRVVVFKASAIYVISGDGPDLTGAGAFPSVTRISLSEGSVPGAVQCSTGQAVYFMAPRQGIYRIDRSLQVSYIGAAVDSALVNPEIGGTVDTVVEALALADRNEIWFFGKQSVYVYNELLDCWSIDPRTWSGNNVLSATYDGTNVVVSDSGGNVWYDTASAAQTAATLGSITTGWISAADLEGWLRLTRIRLLGQMNYVASQLSAQVKVEFDYLANGPKTITTAVNLVNASTRLETELRMAVRCSSFRVTFTWRSTGNSPTIQLSGIVAEISPLPGMRKLPASQRMT